MVNFSHVVLTLICPSRAPVGILQNRYSSRSQAALSDLSNAILKAMFCKYECNFVVVMLVSSSGVCFRDDCYSCSHSRLYQDFLCFSMIYTCNKSLLPNNFLTFNLWMSGIRSVVGRCISLLFSIMRVFPHFISNTSHIQFFFMKMLSGVSSSINLNKYVFLAD